MTKDYTWHVCKDCKHRVLVVMHSQKVQGLHVEEFEEKAYICELGLDRDRNPNFCPFKESESRAD